MHLRIILARLYLGLSSAATLPRPAAEGYRVSGQVSLGRAADSSPPPTGSSSDGSRIHHDRKPGRWNRKKQAHGEGRSRFGSAYEEDDDDRRFPLDILLEWPQRPRKSSGQGHPCPDHRDRQDEDGEADYREKQAGAREIDEARRHWRFTTTRWQDDDVGSESDGESPSQDRLDRLPIPKPLSCFCSAGIIFCRFGNNGLGGGSTYAYGTCTV